VLITDKAAAGLCKGPLPAKLEAPCEGHATAHIFGATSPGPKPRNEDAWEGGAAGPYSFIAVADGVSNSRAGHLAAMSAVEAVKETFQRRFGSCETPSQT
jgi:serine/threonine protein phosphatase PrpC